MRPPQTGRDGVANRFQRLFSIRTLCGEAQAMAFLHAQRHDFHQAATVGRFTAAVEVGDGNVAGELLNGIDQHGTRTGVQAVLVTHHKLGAQQFISVHVIAGQQRQQGCRVRFQQLFSFLFSSRSLRRFSTSTG